MEYNTKKAFLQFMWKNHEELMVDLVEEGLRPFSEDYIDRLRESYMNLRDAFEAGALFKGETIKDERSNTQSSNVLDYNKMAYNILLEVGGLRIATDNYSFYYEPVLGNLGLEYSLNFTIEGETNEIKGNLKLLNEGLETLFRQIRDEKIKDNLRKHIMSD